MRSICPALAIVNSFALISPATSRPSGSTPGPIGAKIGDRERRNGFILRYLPNLVVSRAHCVKVVDKDITMDNLRLLCLAKTSAEGPRDAHGINIL